MRIPKPYSNGYWPINFLTTYEPCSDNISSTTLIWLSKHILVCDWLFIYQDVSAYCDGIAEACEFSVPAYSTHAAPVNGLYISITPYLYPVQVLNVIVEDLFQGHPISRRKLKELLGHTPSQVLAGALIGIAVACFCHQACSVPQWLLQVHHSLRDEKVIFHPKVLQSLYPVIISSETLRLVGLDRKFLVSSGDEKQGSSLKSGATTGGRSLTDGKWLSMTGFCSLEAVFKQ